MQLGLKFILNKETIAQKFTFLFNFLTIDLDMVALQVLLQLLSAGGITSSAPAIVCWRHYVQVMLQLLSAGGITSFACSCCLLAALQVCLQLLSASGITSSAFSCCLLAALQVLFQLLSAGGSRCGQNLFGCGLFFCCRFLQV